MQKVYRLLRNNQELGPYTLEELLQKGLQTHDLIWIEGRSAAWAYPYELEALKAYAPAPPRQEAGPSPSSAVQRPPATGSERHIYVSLPDQQRRPAPRPSADLLEARAEAIRQRAQQFQPAAAALPGDALRTHYAQSLDSAEEAYTHWYYNKKTQSKKSHYRGLLLAALTVAVIAGGLFAGQSLLKSSANSQTPSLRGTGTASTVAVQPTPAPQQQVQPADTLINPSENLAAATPQPVGTNTAAGKKSAPGKPQVQTVTQQQPDPAPVTTTESQVAATAEPAPTTQENTAQPETTEVVTEKKRKGLFGGLFRKKEHSGSKNESTETGERKASRRSDGSTAGTATDRQLTDGIELRSDATREKWMLGVMGQKLTLLNHNSQPIRTAVVEVYYFGEDNVLLDRKRVSVGNVAPKEKATITLPDHRQAEKVTFQVLSAE